MSTPALNPLVTKIRGMHPGAYDDMDDATLTKRVLAKYPQYSDLATPGGDVNNPAASVPRPPNPINQATDVYLPDNASNPGASEGAGLREGLGEWVDRSGGDVVRGGANVVKGNVAKGMHQVLSGGMNAATPALPFAAAAAPMAVARGTIGSLMGGKAASVGAEALGATPDQADLAGDVGGIAGGTVGARLPQIASTRVGQTVAAIGEPLTKLPVIDKVADALKATGKVSGKLSEIWKKVPEQPPAKLPAGFEPAGPQYQAPTGSVDNPATGGIPRGQIAEQMKQPPITRGSLKQMMESLNGPLDRSLGATPPPAPNKPIYQRGGLAEMMKSADVPEGHTAVDSSALKSYKYDAGANEFHARYRSGAMDHVFGDVSPEEAQAFEAAASKGKAMAAIQQNHPLVAKIVDGKRVSIRGSVSAAVKP